MSNYEFQIMCEGFVLNFRRVTGMLDSGEFLLLNTDDLPSAVYLLTVQTPQPSNDGYLIYLTDLV